MAGKSSSPSIDRDSWLDSKPEFRVVCNAVQIDTWYELGTQLEIAVIRLNEIDRDNATTSLKRSKMFAEWLEKQPNATNRQLLNALRVIGKNGIAANYEKKIETSLSVMTRFRSSENQGL